MSNLLFGVIISTTLVAPSFFGPSIFQTGAIQIGEGVTRQVFKPKTTQQILIDQKMHDMKVAKLIASSA
jgi:hypothetical protein